MTPMLPGRKPWHVSLVVADLDTRTATFCQGSIVGKGWVLTAASCVCHTGRTKPLMQVVVERETSVKTERRLEVKSIWLYQDDESNFPSACFDSKLDGLPIPQTFNGAAAADYVPKPTIADLALIQMTLPDDVKEEPEILELIGGKDPKTGALIESLVVNGQGAPRATYDLESVVTAGRTLKANTQPGASYTARGVYLLRTKATLFSSRCDNVDVYTITTGPYTGSSICNSLSIDTRVPSFAGTALVLSDHRRPLGLGVYGPFYPGQPTFSYTSLLQSAPNTKDPIACWLDKRVNSVDPTTPFFYPMVGRVPTKVRVVPTNIPLLDCRKKE